MGDGSPPRAPEALEAIEEIRARLAALPEVQEIVDGHGHHTFRVRDKSFVIIGEGKGSGSLARDGYFLAAPASLRRKLAANS